jgi:cytochrome c3-like protein
MRRVPVVPAAALLVVLGIGGYSLVRWLTHDLRMFLPGRTSDAHHQIEIACQLCHTPFAGVKQEACLRCHGARLAAAQDSHPVDKFAAPARAGGAHALDPTRCVSCHKEHAPHLTRKVAVTQPADFCVHCHVDIGKERPSHRTFAFASCAASGCHNYHDNTALHADALMARRTDPPVLSRPVLAVRDKTGPLPVKKAGTTPPTLYQQWEGSAHARAAVTCPKCHERQETSSSPAAWQERPGPSACVACHEPEVRGFLAGRHGIRLAAGMAAMTPSTARLPMKADARHRDLTCASCHAAHAFDTRPAAVDACLSCHDDGHSRAYLDSPHYALWRAEGSGQKPPGSGVSCATCHLPRVLRDDGRKRVLTLHNESDHLRPVSSMLAPVCLHCHGPAFAIDALADPDLARRNYAGRPSRHVQTLDMLDTNIPPGRR